MDDISNKKRLLGVFAYVDYIMICDHESEIHDQNLHRFLSMKYYLTKSIMFVSTMKISGFEVSKDLLRPDPERLELSKQLSLAEILIHRRGQ